MGHKVNPIGIRLGITRDWASKWYADTRTFPAYLDADFRIRKYLRQRLTEASVSLIQIERPARKAHITIHPARPGVVIGKKGEDIENLKVDLQKIMGVQVHVNIEEIRKPETDAQLIADSIAQQLEKRIMFRRAMKRAMQNAMRLGAQGIKIMSSGRLNGAEIARREWYREGRVPLHTLRADIDYGTSEAKTTYGIIGIKVWVFKGETMARSEQLAIAPETASAEEPTKKLRKATARPAAKPEGEGETRPAAKPRTPRKPATKSAEARPEAAPAGEAAAPVKAPAKRVRKPAAPKAEGKE